MEFRLRWPTDYGVVTQPFLARPGYYSRFRYAGVDGRPYYLPGHEGVDIMAPLGSEVYACANGTVSLVRLDGDTMPYGNQVRIKHGESYETIYAHLSEVRVGEGQEVEAGDVIGLSGETGNAQGAHLHLTVKKKGATLAGETVFKNDIIDPTPLLEPLPDAAPWRGQPSHPMRGLHDEGAADWMLKNKARGWAVETVYSMGDLSAPKPCDYSTHAAAGVRVILRWNYSWAKADGGLGTFPVRSQYINFVNWCVESIEASKGVWGHVIGNETNRAGERPDYEGPANPGTPIMPSDVTYVYNAVWNQLPVEVRGSPPAVDPTNVETMDPLDYWRAIVQDLAGAEFFALHGYSYGSDQAVNSGARFPNMPWQYRSFRMWQPLAKVLYDSKYRRTPLVITETNHLHRKNGKFGWDTDADDWVRSMYDYVREWNRGPGDQYVHGVCLYRLDGDVWRVKDKPGLLKALRESGEKPV